MRRYLSCVLILALVILLSACSNQSDNRNTSPSEPVSPSQGETAETTESIAEQLQSSGASDTEIQVLSLEKHLYSNYEWYDDTLLVLSEHSCVTLWDEDAAKYPELAQALDQIKSMQKKSMEDEYDNLLSSAKGDYSGNPGDFETYTSTLDIQVRRADSIAVSLLSDSWSDYGWIDDFRGMHGTNFDTATGKELAITDVIKDMNKIPAIVARELNSHMWAGDFSYDAAVADYFRNTPEDGISWTLDYNGVTFYFADGDLTEADNGSQTATIAFAQHPELFVEKYMVVPDAYTVRLPLDSSFFTDLDGDGDLEELNVTGWYDSIVGMYAEFGIYTSADGYYHYEQWYADDFIPYYIHTAGGSHYIYLFSRELEGAFPQMSLVVFDITGGQYHRVGEKNVGPGYIPTDNYRVPTDPNNLWLDDFDGMAQDSMAYAVGSMGMPELKSGESSESQIVFAPERMEMLTVHKEALNGTSWVGYAMVNSESAESFPLPYTEPDGTVICVSMELNADGSGWLEFKNKRETITWDCDGAYSVWIVREDGQRADMTAYTMGGENHVWLLIDLNGYLLWLY